MESFEFMLPTRIVFGNNVIEQVGEKARALGKQALIVTDKGVAATGYVEKVQALLKAAGVASEVFAEIDPNPRDISVEKGADMAQRLKADLLVGIGGGSAIDTAKAIGVILKEGGKIQDYEGLDKVSQPITPLIAIPTTAGTGTEVTFWSVITDSNRHYKMSVGSPLIAAREALVDPMLTLSLPKAITAYTGIDALVHCIEGITATLSQPVSDSLALAAIERISSYIRKAYANGNDVSARYHMMLGSMMAGMAFGNTDVASVHCMGEAMGGLYDTPHGLSMAICLPYCIEHNLIAVPEKYARIARAMGENINGRNPMEAAEQCLVAIKKMLKDLNIPDARAVGLKKQDLKKLAKAAAANVSVESNPRILDQEDFLAMFQRAYDNA